MPGRPPVGIQRAHVGRHVLLPDVQLGRVADPLLAAVDRDQIALLRRRPERDSSRSRGSGRLRDPTPRSRRTPPSGRTSPAGSSCCGSPRRRCRTRRRPTPVLSSTSTRSPAWARCQAVDSPWTPAPTTSTGIELGRLSVANDAIPLHYALHRLSSGLRGGQAMSVHTHVVRVPLAWTLAPEAAALLVRDDERPFALIGRWAGRWRADRL